MASRRGASQKPASAGAMTIRPKTTVDDRSPAMSLRSKRITPIRVNTTWVAVCASRSTRTLAAATPPPTLYFRSKRAPKTSPPTCATGSSVLIDSRTQRNLQKIHRLGRGRGTSASPGEAGQARLRQPDQRDPQHAEANRGEGARHLARTLIKGQAGKQHQTQDEGQSGGGFHRSGFSEFRAESQPFQRRRCTNCSSCGRKGTLLACCAARAAHFRGDFGEETPGIVPALAKASAKALPRT